MAVKSHDLTSVVTEAKDGDTAGSLQLNQRLTRCLVPRANGSTVTAFTEQKTGFHPGRGQNAKTGEHLYDPLSCAKEWKRE